MAYETMRNSLPGVAASADLQTKQFFFVKVDGSKTVGLAGDGEAVAGVLQNKPDTGQAATVWGPGAVTKVVAGAAIAAGANVSSDAAGKGKTSTSGDYIVGHAVDAVSADGEVVTVTLTTPGRLA
jgi:hypothetical protein